MKFKFLLLILCFYQTTAIAIEKQPIRSLKTPDKSIRFKVPIDFSSPRYEKGTTGYNDGMKTPHTDIILDRNDEKIFIRKMIIPESVLKHKTAKLILDDSTRGWFRASGDRDFVLKEKTFMRNDLEWRRIILKVNFDGKRYERLEFAILKSNLYYFIYSTKRKDNLESHAVNEFFDSILLQ